MTQHTPGPKDDIHVVPLHREYVAVNIDGREVVVPTRLIAAASEMAEILTRLVDQWDQVSGAPHRTIDQARALLARLDA